MISIGFFSRQNGRVERALFFCLVTIFFSQFSFSAFAEVVTQGSWEKVEDVTVTKGKRFYVRGSGYYTDNTVSLSNTDDLSNMLRVVVTDSSMVIFNANGSDGNGHLYFDLASTDDTTRIWFSKKRGAFNYSVELQQFIEESNPDTDGDGIFDADDICPDDATNSCITIVGLVFGNGAAVDSAAVKVGLNSINTNTDLSGEFTANAGNYELASDGIDSFFPVKVMAQGFASGNAKVIWQAGKTEYQVTVDLQQVSQVITEQDDVTQGVDVNKDGAPVGSLTIPTEALPEGASSITGSITYLDPETDDILSMPGGDLLALPEGADPNDGQVTLETFGMMEFDLVDQNGNQITKLAPAESAEVCMKAPTGLILGDTIPLWYYDEDTGLWKEEGQGTVAERNGELQICGQVSHFSWWNYDQPISTHSCMQYSIESESADVGINGLSWYVEGVTYNGTSPSRSCSNDNGNTLFDSFTVKITTDTDNPEQIKVYTNIGGSKFYLLADGDNTYSLTQSSANAAIFNTPDIQGSCLSNTLSGTCMNLDHQTDNNGILPLSADVDLPPIIMEFSVSSGTLLPGETADVVATVTDPEGSNVTLNWSVNCGYYGNNNGSEFMTPSSDSGASGQQFSAVMTAPDSLSYPIEYCEITLVATDDNDLFSTATRWVTVAASFEFALNGILFGTDGLPLANAPMNYSNWNCDEDNGLQQFTTTDENGQYQFNIDLANCISQEGGFSDLGRLETTYMYDGRSWKSYFELNDYYYGGIDGGNDGGVQTYCTIAQDGATVCDVDINLPVLWRAVSGDVHLPADIDPAGYSYLNINLFQSSILGGLSFLDDNTSLDLSNSPTSFGPIMAPVGRLFVHHSYQTLAGVGESQWNVLTNSSTDSATVDIGNLLTTVPIVISVFDANNLPMPNVEIDFVSDFGNSSTTNSVIDIEGTTDSNGEYTANAYLGSINGNSLNPFHYYSDYIVEAGSTKYIDLGSTQQCLIEGQLVDVFGEPIANEFFNVFDNFSNTDFVTDGNGYFSTPTTPGYFQIEGQNYHAGYFNHQIDNCRPVAGQPRVIRFDAVMYESFFGLE